MWLWPARQAGQSPQGSSGRTVTRSPVVQPGDALAHRGDHARHLVADHLRQLHAVRPSCRERCAGRCRRCRSARRGSAPARERGRPEHTRPRKLPRALRSMPRAWEVSTSTRISETPLSREEKRQKNPGGHACGRVKGLFPWGQPGVSPDSLAASERGGQLWEHAEIPRQEPGHCRVRAGRLSWRGGRSHGGPSAAKHPASRLSRLRLAPCACCMAAICSGVIWPIISGVIPGKAPPAARSAGRSPARGRFQRHVRRINTRRILFPEHQRILAAFQVLVGRDLDDPVRHPLNGDRYKGLFHVAFHPVRGRLQIKPPLLRLFENHLPAGEHPSLLVVPRLHSQHDRLDGCPGPYPHSKYNGSAE